MAFGHEVLVSEGFYIAACRHIADGGLLAVAVGYP